MPACKVMDFSRLVNTSTREYSRIPAKNRKLASGGALSRILSVRGGGGGFFDIAFQVLQEFLNCVDW